ncbi:hypothetical protein [Micromonospora sp. NPDC048830]|uniref:hypothetical protein n=1 Tax=Micromonospora sp. NPDC048830 TaxID=3364257 RepID=UPI003711C4CA
MRSARSVLRVASLATLVGISLLTAACASGSDLADTTPPAAACQPTADQKALLEGLHSKALTGYTPEGTRSTESHELSAACTTNWPEPHGAVPPAKRVAAIENDYITTNAMTAAQLVATFGKRAVTEGWQPNGSWDDSQGDGSAYAVYCQQISGSWSNLSVYRGPKVEDTMPLRVLVEAYPGVTHCPGRPQDG